MSDEEPTQRAKQELETVEAGVLDRLLGVNDQHPWSVDELIRDVGDRMDAIDAIKNLHGLGLVHRCGELIFPTRGALRADQLTL